MISAYLNFCFFVAEIAFVAYGPQGDARHALDMMAHILTGDDATLAPVAPPLTSVCGVRRTDRLPGLPERRLHGLLLLLLLAVALPVRFQPLPTVLDPRAPENDL